MALENLAVEGMTVEIVEASDATLSATITITDVPVDEVLCDGKKVYDDGTIIQGLSYSGSGGTNPGPLFGTLDATTNVNFAVGEKILREGDKTVTLTVPLTSGTTVTNVTYKFQITDANQDRVMGE